MAEQAPTVIRIDQLRLELMTRVQMVATLQNKTFYVVNVDELEDYHTEKAVQFPMSGVSYEGMHPKGNQADANTNSKASMGNAVVRFSVIVGDEYRLASMSDPKPSLTDMLDAVRSSVNGFIGITHRPWKWLGETPLVSRLQDTVFYGQLWENTIHFN